MKISVVKSCTHLRIGWGVLELAEDGNLFCVNEKVHAAVEWAAGRARTGIDENFKLRRR
jgi:hypothetical protein